nr:unnamed protein product [Spirometra erinaceieuropaei]
MSRQPGGYLLDTLLALLLVCTATCKLHADEAERVARELEEPVWSGLQNLLIPAPETSETFGIHDESPGFDLSAREVPVYRPARSRYNGIRQSAVYQDQQNIPWADGSKETGVPFRLVENQVLPNGQFSGATTRESQKPRQSSELVWNEQGQYWGYAPQTPPNNNARRGTTSGGGTGVVDDGTCLPPFCVPAVCSDTVNCAAPCITQNCDVGCFPPCIGGKDCIAGVCRCAALQRGSACRLLAANVCQQHFHLTCPIGCFLPVSLNLPPDCDCVFPPQALFTPSCALPVSLTCPDNCSGRGHCDTATGKCSCKPGFTGENCAATDPCSPESGLTPCQFKCVSVNATRVCLCPSPFILQPDGVSCGLACPPGLTGTDCRTDIDECLTGTHNCQQDCINTFGSYRCKCREGFIPTTADETKCTPVQCNPRCVEGQGTCSSNGKCECQKGFQGTECEKDIDECNESGQNQCHHRCINTFGSFRCECDPGYNLDPRDNRTCIRDKCFDSCVPGQGECENGRCVCRRGFKGRDCELDVDECREQPNICDQRCVNSFGSFRCECDPGYNLDPRDNRTCMRDKCYDSCVPGQGECQKGRCVCRRGFKGRDCQGECENGRCVCRRGFKGSDCELDVDECREQPNICDQRCVNSFGSFRCECDPGYVLDPRDNRTCIRDKCYDSCVPGQGECENGRCVCRRGFKGRDCELDVDECREQPNICDQRCVNSFGSFRCECNPGYNLDPRDNRTCVRDKCFDTYVPGQGECQNGRCMCRRGFKGRDCELDVDECREQPNICDQRCVNSFGSFRCECDPGYNLDPRDNRTCVRDKCFDSCVPGQGECQNGRCVCRRGFKGRDCELDVDECREQPNICDQRCVNSFGSFRCECNPGYNLDPRDNRTCVRDKCFDTCVPGQGECENGHCVCLPGFTGINCELDIDECLLGTHTCDQICINTPGSYRCECQPGYAVSASGGDRCERLDCNSHCVPGQGDCSDSGECQCRPGYEGEWCELEVDLCSAGRHTCEHICVSSQNSFFCRCHDGFRPDPRDPSKCLPLGCPKECVPGQGICKPETGQCECKPGFQGDLCDLNVDECSLNNGGCSHKCVDTFGSFHCECPPGWRLAPNSTRICELVGGCNPPCVPGQGTCVDTSCCKCNEGYMGISCEIIYNACKALKPCQQRCVNLGGGNYECSCWTGFVPAVPGDASTCVRSCLPGKNCIHGECITRVGEAPFCRCKPGFRGSQCDEDINECLEARGHGLCQQVCTNTFGSYRCSCDPGYVLQPDGVTCIKQSESEFGDWVNVDACKEKQPCEQLCFNTREGDYQCACTEGFELNADGRTCSPTKLCNPPCANGARCLHGRCLCPPGYEGARCDIDIDECSLPASVHGCSFGCTNLPGSYECTCPPGYLLLADKKTCTKPSHDADCQMPCQNGGICTGKNICRCLRGFTGKDCSLDIDECQRYRPCDPDYGFCVNRYGGFDCECKPGYVLLVDGRHCIEEARARQAPHLVYRGKGTKGVVVGGGPWQDWPRRTLGAR